VAIGAGVGAGTGALADSEDRLRGAIRGGVVGGAAGAAAPLITGEGRKRAVDAARKWGKAQVHSVTGRGKIFKPGTPEAAAQKAGLTSIPGFVKGMIRKPGKTIKAGWKSTPTTPKLLTGGFAALNAPHILNRSTREGHAEKGLSDIGAAGTYMLAGRMPLLGSMGLAAGAGLAGKYLGRGIDRLYGYKPGEKPYQNVQTQVGNVTADRVRADAGLVQQAGRKLIPAANAR